MFCLGKFSLSGPRLRTAEAREDYSFPIRRHVYTRVCVHVLGLVGLVGKVGVGNREAR